MVKPLTIRRTLNVGLLPLSSALGLRHADQALLDDTAFICLNFPKCLALWHLLHRCTPHKLMSDRCFEKAQHLKTYFSPVTSRLFVLLLSGFLRLSLPERLLHQVLGGKQPALRFAFCPDHTG